MNGKQKWSYMRIIVALCLGFLAAFCVAAYVALWFGVDTINVLKIVAAIFGGELVMMLLKKMLGIKNEGKAVTKPATIAKPTENKPPGVGVVASINAGADRPG